MSKSKLIRFTYSRGGDMRGSFRGTEIAVYDETRALYTEKVRQHHAAEEEERRYLIDAAVLPELERVFRARGLRFWQHRKIARQFVADGASKSYRFTFDNEKAFYFSAQYYPGLYGAGTDALWKIIDKYTEKKEELPDA